MSDMEMGMWDREYPSEEESAKAEESLFETDEGAEEYEEGEDFELEGFDLEEYEEDEPEEDIMLNARTRLEQGRLYEMLIKHDLFDGVDALPAAIANVEKEIKSFITERLEILLGMKSEKEPVQQVVYDSQFNDMEIKVLKMIASTASKGATKDAPTTKPEPSELNTVTAKPKTNTLNSLGGNSNKTKPAPAPKKKMQKRPPSKPLRKEPSKKLKKEVLEVGTENMNLDEIAKRDMKYVESLKSLPLEKAAEVVAKRHNRPKSKTPISQDVVNSHYSNRMATNEMANTFTTLLALAKKK